MSLLLHIDSSRFYMSHQNLLAHQEEDGEHSVAETVVKMAVATNYLDRHPY